MDVEEPNDREQQDRMFLEQMLISVRGLRGRIGLGQGSEPIIQRAFALVLMREALAALDAVGDTDVAPHLQLAIDRLLEPRGVAVSSEFH
ncbi:hypothetical protein [Sphingobium baderi]|uniref:Uncharacterized protein n=1 Tax=Sphingobium baderi LL03 TaxID=1114964 RepID=T0GWM2_9SPHN|nr:hypothetical protein [Sphingobium baderi]EQB05102.1 hypothetical protein L485_03010 [Sphingobium baderi LL03]KMS60104.1 hypothetical protein V475_19755 [Sphingobium baderi LL03]